MSSNSDKSDLPGIRLSKADEEAFWREAEGAGSVLGNFARSLSSASAGVKRRCVQHTGAQRRGVRRSAPRPTGAVRSAVLLIAGVALLFGLGGTASGATNRVSAAETALARATRDRVAVENRLAAARTELARIERTVTRLGEEDEELTQKLAEARESMREFAIAAYIDGGKSDIMRATLDPEKAQALAWQSTLSAGQSTSAEEVSRNFEELKALNSPKRLAAAENLERARQAVTDVSNDAIQAAAFERDAEAALADARREARAAADADRAREQAAKRATAAASKADARVVNVATPVSKRRSAPVPGNSQPVEEPSSGVRGNPTQEESATLARIRRCESGGNYSIVSASGRYRGAYQFDYRTWAGVGGTGDPAAASPAEQDYRALILLRQRGTRPWPVCGR